MKSLFTFLKTTILGGIFVIVPLVLVYVVLAEAVDMVLAIVQPVAGMVPKDWVLNESLARLLAALFILAVAFLTGLVTRTRTGVRAGSWFERTVLHRMPGYQIAKTLTRQVSGSEADSQFAPAVIRKGPDTLILGYIIEEHVNGYFTVFIPSSPVGTAGGLQYVSGERVERLNVPISKVFNCISQYGIGSGPLFMPHTPEKAAPEADRIS
jgi:uncharacterized membrane protein